MCPAVIISPERSDERTISVDVDGRPDPCFGAAAPWNTQLQEALCGGHR